MNRDNNVRYVALNALCNAVSSNTDAIQRHRNTIVECLKDADLTIRKHALDLIHALTNKKNIRSLARDLLNCFTISNTTTSFEYNTSHNKSHSKYSKDDGELEVQLAMKNSENDGQPIFIYPHQVYQQVN